MTPRIVSPEPVLLQRLKALRWYRLTTEPYARLPQVLTDTTWERLTDLWEDVARILRGRPLASALAEMVEDA